jgi:hypothetical protein
MLEVNIIMTTWPGYCVLTTPLFSGPDDGLILVGSTPSVAQTGSTAEIRVQFLVGASVVSVMCALEGGGNQSVPSFQCGNGEERVYTVNCLLIIILLTTLVISQLYHLSISLVGSFFRSMAGPRVQYHMLC